MTAEERDEALNKNYDFFKSIESELIKNRKLGFALIRDQKLLKVFKTLEETYLYANRKFPDKLFSIQKINQGVIYTGLYS